MDRWTPPRFITRTLIATLATIAFVLTAVFIVVASSLRGDSIDPSARPLLRSALQSMAAIALGAFVLAAVASLWLVRTLSRSIDTLSRSLNEMTRTRTFDRPLPSSSASREIDALTDAFNTMIGSIQTAEAETIRALALALDARDPYRAGHSERVSALSVAIGRQMRLDDDTVEVLRFGALLHDIGKIGISDTLLRKPSPLTAEEYETIKTHPAIGSRVLKNVRFLEPHRPVIELHHERPDGGGYPFGLEGDKIPMTARIVHVADAYDAMTSARAYRPALPRGAALAELQRGGGTHFDADVVAALMKAVAQDDQLADDDSPLVETDEFRSEAELPPARSRHDEGPNPLDDFDSEGQVA